MTGSTDASVSPLPRLHTGWREKIGEYTHLTHGATLLVGDWRKQGPDTHLISVRWPSNNTTGGADPRLLAQTVRQCGLLVAHAAYGVPTGHHTLLHSLNITTEPGFRAGEGASFEVRLTVTRAERRSSTLSMVLHIRSRDRTVAIADTVFAWVSPAAYRRMRGRRLHVDWAGWPVPDPAAPHLVGRLHHGDVLLADGGSRDRWRLRNDVSNILLFDHPVDHVPGLVLLEAAQQAAHALTYPDPVEFTDVSIEFARYVEFDEPCWLTVEPLTTLLPEWSSLRIAGRQGERDVFRARLKGLRPAS
ncbi:A-factor biosynthesis protein [Streptomyces spongiicola]|uniref:A-factor biosynthesis protein n=1 Tax=Streptomyces spongiicola TaxID=1690221 RepID=A0A2S1YXR4_9ACTN|nr:ScbA/BarX family gamma-butyrolactone biosynthesis protein [Streptomyces spongiicola]AWK08889.1 A-factor biosynthesis protein [Streptomyces spongiicola]GBP99766.1 A-factor biosynthesis protein [Streptomyces spongiicola]